MCFEEPKRVFLRSRQVVTLLHHPPPYKVEKKKRTIHTNISWLNLQITSNR